MRKFTFLYLLFLVAFEDGFSQSYVPMPMQNCEWYLTNSQWCYQIGWPTSQSSSLAYKIFPNGDSIINTKRYIKFYSQNLSCYSNSMCPLSCPSVTTPVLWGLLRQDTLGKKIFHWEATSGSELLFYNFNLVKGDSVKTTLGTYTTSLPPGGDPYRIVDSVYYQTYNDGICRKTWKLKPYPNTAGLTETSFFTEGIGNYSGIGTKSQSRYFGNISNNTQYFFASQLVINNFTVSSVSTNTCLQNVGIEELNQNSFTVFPNPVTDKLIIEGLGSELNQIELFSVLGQKQKIAVSVEEKTHVVDLENCQSGIYILRISSGDKSYSKKILKTD